MLIGSGGWILWNDGPARAGQTVDRGAPTGNTATPTTTGSATVNASPRTTPTTTPDTTSTSLPILETSPTITAAPSETSTPVPPPSATPDTTPTPLPTLEPSPTITPTSTETSTPVPSPSATPDLAADGTPAPYLSRYRLVTYYGSPSGPDLGVLGAWPRHILAERLRETAAQYQALSPYHRVLPTFHIITTVADAIPGEVGKYSHHLGLEIIADWVAAARSESAAVILDIQPGHASIEEEFGRIQYYLYSPHVHLALDSEFTMEGGQIPGLTLGQIYAQQINEVQARLNDIAVEIGTNKVLIVHQFEGHMVPDKAAIADYPYVELVFDADGFGHPDAKSGDYGQYAAEPGFEYGGFKLFFEWDYPLMSPAQVMALDPPPMVIIYQ